MLIDIFEIQCVVTYNYMSHGLACIEAEFA